MKIGILTYHSVYNFGANLQVLSTVGYLKKKGFNPIVINWIPYDLEQYYNRITSSIQANAHKTFQKQYLPLSQLCRNTEDIKKCIIKEGIEAIIIGSDALLNIRKSTFNWKKLKKIYPTSDHQFPNAFWGDFIGDKVNIPIAGLSLSCQNANYYNFKPEKEIVKKHLKNFNYISVRDNWTKDMIKFFTDDEICPHITPDPVFAFNSNVTNYISRDEIHKKYNLPENYFLLSFSGGKIAKASCQWIKDFVKYGAKYNISCVQFPRTTGGQDLNLDYKIQLPLSPIDWYFIIKYSRGYIGVLMHPIISAMHNNIPFFSFDHYGIRKCVSTNPNSSKIYHIINESGLINNYHSLKLFKPFPKAKIIIDSLIHFNKDICMNFSKKQENYFFSNMDEIIKSFII